MTYLVTGGCGFIGSNFIHLALNSDPNLKIVNIDKLTYAANPDHNLRLSNCFGNRYSFFRKDICDDLSNIFEQYDFQAVINFAAESHVDNSIDRPGVFIQTNVVGAYNLLEHARHYNVKFIQVSTDEVYGPITVEADENFNLNPSSPYSASKAAADLLVLGNYTTFKQDVIITRCVNNYGPYQHNEKLIPKIITNALQDIDIPIYGDGQNVREWIHVEDHCKGILLAIKYGKPGNIYNFGSGFRTTNKKLAENILNLIPTTKSKIVYVEDRKGHDYRYAVQSFKAQKELCWTATHTKFSAELAHLITQYKHVH